MPHRYAVAHRYRGEYDRRSARRRDAEFYRIGYLIDIYMPGNYLVIRTDNADKGARKFFFGNSAHRLQIIYHARAKTFVVTAINRFNSLEKISERDEIARVVLHYAVYELTVFDFTAISRTVTRKAGKFEIFRHIAFAYA